MSVKKEIIEQFIKTRGFAQIDSSSVSEVLDRFRMCSSSQSNRINGLASRPSSVCSFGSTFSGQISNDPGVPASLDSAIKRLSLKTLLSYYLKSGSDENSSCLVYAFLLLIGCADKDGPASQIKNMRSKVVPIFNQYLRNPAELIRYIKRLPVIIKVMQVSDATYKKALALFKLVNYKKLAIFQDIYYYVKECLGFVEAIKRSAVNHCSTVQSDPNQVAQAENFKTKPPVSKHKKSISSVDFKDLHLEANPLAKKRKTGSIPPKNPRKPDRKLIKKEKFLKDCRISKKIQKRLSQDTENTQNGTVNKKAIIAEVLSKLPCKEISNSSVELFESYINKPNHK